MSNVIAFVNQKGGVAKTTSTVNLGVGLAKAGKKVLLIDNDPQGSLTQSLGIAEPDRLTFSLASVFGKLIEDEEISHEEGILHSEEGVDFLPANIELSGVETSLVGVLSSETLLRDYTDLLRPLYDFILVDCSPNLNQLTLNALVAADEVIIPVQAAYLPMKGLEQLLKTVRRIHRKLNPSLRISGILLTMVDYRTTFAKEVTEAIYDAYQDQIRIFDAKIPFSVRAAEQSAAGESIFSYDGNGKVAQAYAAFAQEVMDHE